MSWQFVFFLSIYVGAMCGSRCAQVPSRTVLALGLEPGCTELSFTTV